MKLETLKTLNLLDLKEQRLFLTDYTAKQLGINASGLDLKLEDFALLFDQFNSPKIKRFLIESGKQLESNKIKFHDDKYQSRVLLTVEQLGVGMKYHGLNIEIENFNSGKQPRQPEHHGLNLSEKVGRLTILFTGVIFSSNKRAENLFERELKGSRVQDLVHPEYLSDILNGMQGLRDGTLQEVAGIVKTNDKKWLECFAMVEPNPTRRFICIYFTEISTVKRKEKILERKLRLRERNIELLNFKVKQLESISFGMSHDLRNPVANFKLILDILQEQNQQEELKEWIEGMVSSNEKLSDQLNSYLELLSSLKANELLLGVDSVIDLNQFISKILAEFKQEIMNQKIHVSLNFQEPQQVVSNESLLRSVFQNLISNAIKYRDYDRALYIELGSDYEDGVILYCKDNGIGLDLEKYGEKVFAANKKFTSRPNSTGIGLYLIKQQLELHGGQIWVESKPNEGSTFYVKLRGSSPMSAK